MLQTYGMPKLHRFFTNIELDTSNVFTRITAKMFAFMYCKIEIRFEIFGMTFSEYVKFVIKGLKFVFSDCCPCRFPSCFATKVT